jgi:GNAT superfamily N-acetyltransferase
MGSVTIGECTVDELAGVPNFVALCDEYSRESAIAELGGGKVDVEMYRAMEQAGYLRLLVARCDDDVVGFAVVILSRLPHFSKFVAGVESFFVARAARAGGTGARLRDEAERIARDAGADALLLSAPVGGALDRVLQRTHRARLTNHLYVVSLQ